MSREGVDVVTHSVPRSIVHHLNPECRHLRRARCIVRSRQSNLWPGFVCAACRDEASCSTCQWTWPYCSCQEAGA